MQRTSRLQPSRAPSLNIRPSAASSQSSTHTLSARPLSSTKQHSGSSLPLSTTFHSKASHTAPRPSSTSRTPKASISGFASTSARLKTPSVVGMPSMTTSASRTTAASPSPYATSHRTLFIQTSSTPNPRSLKFLPGKDVLPSLDDGSPNTAFFDSENRTLARQRSTLAYTILCIDGVMNVMFGDDFITVTINEGEDWLGIKPLVFAAISDAFASDEPILKPQSQAEESKEQPTLPGDEEAVALIKEIIDLRIRPTVMDDGGDLEFIKFDENRVVWLLLKGSCSGCPSSGATLKQGIQNMIMHYVPEVLSVEEYKDQLATVSDEALQKLEERLEAKRKTTGGDDTVAASVAPDDTNTRH